MKMQSGVINWGNLYTDDATEIRVLELLESLKEELQFEHSVVDKEVFTKAMHQIMDSVVSKMNLFDHTQLVKSIQAVAIIVINNSWLYFVPSGFNNAWLQAATNHLDQFTPTELAVSIDAITYLGLDDSQESQAFGNAWMAAATQQLKKFTSEDLAMIIYSI